MRKHFRSWWVAYLLAVLAIGYMTIGVIVELDNNERESRCLKAGYHYVDNHCYETIVPAEWDN